MPQHCLPADCAWHVSQKIEVHVRREDDAKYYSNFDVRTRVHVQVDASEMMPFNKDEIDSSPLG